MGDATTTRRQLAAWIEAGLRNPDFVEVSRTGLDRWAEDDLKICGDVLCAALVGKLSDANAAFEHYWREYRVNRSPVKTLCQALHLSDDLRDEIFQELAHYQSSAADIVQMLRKGAT